MGVSQMGVYRDLHYKTERKIVYFYLGFTIFTIVDFLLIYYLDLSMQFDAMPSDKEVNDQLETYNYFVRLGILIISISLALFGLCRTLYYSQSYNNYAFKKNAWKEILMASLVILAQASQTKLRLEYFTKTTSNDDNEDAHCTIKISCF